MCLHRAVLLGFSKQGMTSKVGELETEVNSVRIVSRDRFGFGYGLTRARDTFPKPVKRGDVLQGEAIRARRS